ncbi:MAG: signal recognition particle-docking protein FtsY [Solirubrobacterales bacterium]
MAKTWQDAFMTAGAVVPPPAEIVEESKGFFRRLRENLSASREALGGELRATFTGPLDDETWERLEEALIFADVGAQTTAKVVEQLERETQEGSIGGGEDLVRRLRELLVELATRGDDRIDVSHSPSVILVVGVNGTGKTTTIGKVAWHLREELGLSVMIAAGDTYRAAAQEQLAQWAERAGADIVSASPGSDPAAVVFDAIEAAQARDHNIVIADTAGRLHTQVPLMEELVKVRRVIVKRIPDAPHETLLTIDATTGQNGLRQAGLFKEAVDVTGIVLTKLDGTAKGGIALAIAQELEIPVKLIGIGEALEDLRPFDPDEFARALLDE